MNIDKVPFYNIPDLTGFKVSLLLLLIFFFLVETLRCSYHTQD